MKIVQTKLLLLASALFVATSCDCLKKAEKKEQVETKEVASNDMVEGTLMAENEVAEGEAAVVTETDEVAPQSEVMVPTEIPADEPVQAPAEVTEVTTQQAVEGDAEAK